MASAVHGTVVVVDVAGFGDLRRTNQHQLTVRRSLYLMLARAFGDTWAACHREDRGDGILIVVPATVPKTPLVESLPKTLSRLLEEHNACHDPPEQIRLRLALHAGEIHRDEHGVAGRAVNLAFRLVDAPVFRELMTTSSDPLGVITSAWFYEEVVWHLAPAGYEQVAIEAKETSTTAWIWLPSARTIPAPAVPALQQLPTNTRQFVGRDAEIGRLMRLLDETTTGTVIITAIDGSAGIGKTTLALHWAHQVKDRFPDGQLHVNLRGFDPGDPMDAGQALHDFLQALGVAPKSIPADLDAKAAMYRSRLAGKRILIMLDNARSAEHVRPLLPGTSSCVAIVTSRNRLDSLAIREGAARIALDVLTAPEALALLAKRIGQARLDAEPDAGTEIIDLCARLPLALSLVAARAADYPAVALSTLARELRAERSRLDALDMGELDLNLRTVFSWSYQVLSPSAARLFRLLGVHPGPDIDSRASQALVGQSPRTMLNELIRAHMLAEYVPGRYRFHDLLRAYAAELAADDPEWTDAATRMLDYYLETALRADTVIQPCRDGVARTPANDLSYSEAMEWLAQENTVVLAAITFAADRGFAGHAWRLAWAITTSLRRAGRYQDRLSVHVIAAAAARKAGDRLGLATALRNAGRAHFRLGTHANGLGMLTQALQVFEELDDAHGVLIVQTDRATALGALARHEEASALLDSLAESASDNELLAADLTHLRSLQLHAVHRDLEALSGFERALVMYRRVGNREGEAATLLDLAEVELDLGHYPEALEYSAQALAVERALGDRYYEAVALDRMGDSHAAQGDVDQAHDLYVRSAAILEEIHSARAGFVRSKTK